MGLFDEQIALKPDHYPWTQDFIDKFWATFWTPNEFDFKSDYNQFKKEMPEEEKQMLVKTLTAIGQVEIAVKKFWAKLGDNLPHPSISDLGYTMANTEVIHGKAYTRLLDKLKLNKAFEENLKDPTLAGRVGYLRKHNSKVYTDDQRKQYLYSIILFTMFVENVSLFSQFYIVLHLNKFNNILKDTSQQIKYTRNEEMLHAQIGIKLINTLREEYPELFDEELTEKILTECRDAFEAESKIIDWMVGDYDKDSLNADILKEYIKNRINESLIQIKMQPQFEIDQELIEKTLWMEEETIGNNMVDFFSSRPVDYSKKNRVFSEEELF